jgi:hypothetical protein
MKKITFLTFAVTLFLSSEVIEKSWNLLGAKGDVDLSSTFSTHTDISVVWAYKSGEWVAYGNNQEFKNKISTNGIKEISTIDSGKGFWVLNNGEAVEVTIQSTGVENFPIIENGWNLLASGGKRIDLEKSFKNIELVWGYDDLTQSWGVFSPKQDVKDQIKNQNLREIKEVSPSKGFWVLNNGSDIQVSPIELNTSKIEKRFKLLLAGSPICVDGGKVEFETEKTENDSVISETNNSICGLSEVSNVIGTDGNCEVAQNIVTFADGDFAYEYKTIDCACSDCDQNSATQTSVTNLPLQDGNCSWGGTEETLTDSMNNSWTETTCLSKEQYLITHNLHETRLEINSTLAVGSDECKYGGVSVQEIIQVGDTNLSSDTNIFCKNNRTVAKENEQLLLTEVITTTLALNSECKYGGEKHSFTQKLNDEVVSEWETLDCHSYIEYSRLNGLGEIGERNETLQVGDENCQFGGYKSVLMQKVGADKMGNDINKTWETFFCSSETPVITVDLGEDISFTIDDDVQVGETGEDFTILEIPDVPSAIVTLETNDSLEDVVADLGDQIEAETGATVSQVTLQHSKTCQDSVTSEITILNPNRINSSLLLKDIVKAIVGNEINVNAPTTTLAEYFKVRLTLTKVNGELFVTVAVVDEALYDSVVSKTKQITACSNLYSGDYEVLAGQDSFTVEGNSTATKEAKFLWVIDDSGSMGDDQIAIKKAVADFGNAIEKANVSFKAGVIGTGKYIDKKTYNRRGYANYSLSEDGVVENELSELKENVVLGTWGCGIETGIYNAEVSLSEDGFAKELLEVDENSSVFVIIVSDEPSQYTRRSGGSSFDVQNNIFVENGYKVYSLIEPHQNSRSQYDDLAITTGGLSANIRNRDVYGELDFSGIMNTIANEISGSAVGIELSNSGVIVPSIEVTVNGQIFSDWDYVESSNSIVFYGELSLDDGISISYSYVSEVEVPEE